MVTPRVLIVIDTSAAWSRGILRGFARIAHEHGWIVLHYLPGADLKGLASQWPLNAAVLGPSVSEPWPFVGRRIVSVSVNADRSAQGVASVCLDEARIAHLALAHLLARGCKSVTTFRFNSAPFAVLREKYFLEAAARAGVRVEKGWWASASTGAPSEERPDALRRWLSRLGKPCGVFSCCDVWGHVLARHARAASLRVPEDLALIGVDNDTIECEIVAPPLSSVVVPWTDVGEAAARLVVAGLQGKPIGERRVVVGPMGVASRRSTDASAIADAIVASAVSWIRQHASERLTLTMISRAVGVPRQRLVPHFRRALGRTVMQEVRIAHVELAQRLLSTSDAPLPEIARRSGFSNAGRLGIAFRRELGVSPGSYRRWTRSGSPATWTD